MRPWLLFFLGSAFVMLIICPLYTSGALRKRPAAMTAVKGIGTFIAAGFALHGAMRLPDMASWFVAAGLTVGAIADMVLRAHFIAGMHIFLAGHILYLCAYRCLAPILPASLFIFALLYIAVAGLFDKKITRMGKDRFAYSLYGAVLLLMLSVALLLPARAGARGLAAAAGAILFAVSDLMLARSLVVPPSGKRSYSTMGLYYCAQLALSLVSLRPWLC